MGFYNLFLAVVLLNSFAYITIRLRPKLFGATLFRPMIKNFKLSLVPFLVLFVNCAVFLVMVLLQFKFPFMREVSIAVFGIGFVIWLLMLPNSGYLITELNLTHRDVDTVDVPIWYDIVSVISFALSGIVNILANIVMIQIIILIVLDPAVLSLKYSFLLFVTGLCLNLLVSIGVYLGRTIRFNSWDIIHLGSFFKKLINNFKRSGEWRNFFLFVVFHTTFFMIMYFVMGIPQYFVK